MEVPDFERAQYVQSEALQPGTTAFDPLPMSDHMAFNRAIGFGALYAFAGSILYALVGLWVQIGFVAIVVGGIIGKGMMNGSRGAGGRKYQIAAVILTYFAVSFAMVLDLVWEETRSGKQVFASQLAHFVLLFAVFLFGPFLALAEGLGGGLIGLLILFFGMQAAWRITKGGQPTAIFERRGPEPPTTLGLR